MGAKSKKDALNDLIKEMEAPLSQDVIQFFQKVDARVYQIVSVEFETPADPFKTGASIFNFRFRSTDASSLQIISVAWSPIIEGELFRRGIKVESKEQEALRGGTLLLSNLRLPDIEFGEGYTSGVLYEVIAERFGNIDLIQQLLAQVAANRPYQSEHYRACKSYLKSAIDGYGNSLVVQLRYADNSAFAILVGAISYLLDQRFHISLRKILYSK